MRLDAMMGNDIQLTATALARVGAGTLAIVPGVDGNLGNTVGADARVLGGTILGQVTTTPQQLATLNNIGGFSGVNAEVTAGSILRLASSTDASASFVRYDPVIGFVTSTGANPLTNTFSGATSATIANITSATAITGTASVFGVTTTANISGGTLSVRSMNVNDMGALIINGTSTISSNVLFNGLTPSVSLTGASTNATTTVTLPSTAGLVVGQGISGPGIPAGATIATIASGTSITISAAATATASNLTLAVNSATTGASEGIIYVSGNVGVAATLSGNVDARTLTKTGAGTLALTGSNGIYGALTVNNGILRLGSSATTKQTTGLVLNDTGTLDLNGSNVTVASLAGTAGVITNSSATPGSLTVSGPASTTFLGNIVNGTGTTALIKSGTGTLTLGNITANNIFAGQNSFTGGVTVNQGILVAQDPLALGGANGSTPGTVTLQGGELRLNSNGGGPNGTIIFGNPASNGLNLAVAGYATVNVNRVSANTGNQIQVGNLSVANSTLSLTGDNSYSLRVAGTTTLGGAYANFATVTRAPTYLDLAGPITGAGALNKLGGDAFGTVRISGSGNTYSGGTNIQTGALQVTTTASGALGTGPVSVLPGAALRIAGNGSLGGVTALNFNSQINSLPALVLDTDYNPGTGLNGIMKRNGGFGVALQIAVPAFNTALDMATFGDGTSFLGGYGSNEIQYLAPTLGVGAGNTYRIGANNGPNLAFVGSDNVLGSASGAGTARVVVGNPLANLQGSVITNNGGTVIFRNSNDYSGGTSISKGSSVTLDTGSTATPLGSGTVEVYGTLALGNPGGLNSPSFYNSALNANSNVIQLRPGGALTIVDQLGAVADGQGRWADATGQDINGGTFRLTGAANAQSYERVGTLTANKGSTITVARVVGAGSATLETSALTRGTNATLGLATSGAGTLGIPNFVTTTGTTAASTTVTVASTAGMYIGQPISGAGIPANATISAITNATTLTISAAAVVGAGVITVGIAPTSFDRLIVTAGVTRAGTTNNGTGVVNGGIAPVWIVDRTSNSYVGYNPTAATTGFQTLIAPDQATLGAGQMGYSSVSTAGAIGALAAGTTLDVRAAATLSANSTLYALRSGSNISPTATFNTITFDSGAGNIGGGLLLTGGTISPLQTASATVTPVTLPMTLAFGANEAVIYNGVATAQINAQITGTGGLTKFGPNQLTLTSSNPGLTAGNITVNEGTLFLQNPVSNSGAAIASATGPVGNYRDLILNGAAGVGSVLVIDSFLSNNAGRDSNIASGVRLTGNIGSNVFVNADSRITTNNQAFMQRINNLTIADLGANSPIYLDLVQNGLTVTGTTSLGANTTFINSAFGASNQSILEGVVSGAGNVGGKLVKTGNGGLFFLNAANTFGLAGQTGLEVWASTQNTATGLIGTTVLGAGTPFGVGDINLLPGTLIRLADAANIAGQKVTSNSDAWGYSGVSIGYNNNGAPLSQANILSLLTTSGATNGKIQLNTTGTTLGVISLDNGVQYGALDIGAMETALNQGGAVEHLWLGSMTSGAINQLYFAPTLGASTDGVYRLGGGGNQGTIQFGAGAFENVLTGATSVQIGALVGDVGSNAYNNQSVINGNFNLTLNTRNNYTGDTWANRASTLNIGNNFALGSGKLIANHTSNQSVNIGQGQEGAVSAAGISLLNNVDLVGDLRTAGANFVLRGNVNLAPTAAGGNRTIEATGEMAILGVVSGAGSNLLKAGASGLTLNGINTYTGTTTLTAGSIIIGTDALPNTNGALGNSNTPLLINGANTLFALSGQVTMGRDIITAGIGADNQVITILGNSLYTSKVTGGMGLTLSAGTGRIHQLQAINTGRLELLGPITSSVAGQVRIGDTANPATRAGVVYFGADANGYSPNTYAGNTYLDNARIVIGADSLYSGAPNALTIISSPFGTSTVLFGGGSNNGGTSIGSDGANRIIPNALAGMGTAATLPVTFEGRGNLTFINTTAVNVSTEATTLRGRNFVVNTTQGVIQLDANLTQTATEGTNLVKQGGGILVYTGTNQASNRLTSNPNYGTSWSIEAGQLRVTNDNNLGDTSILFAAGTPAHTVAGLPSDVQLRGGTLSVGGSFTSAHQFLMNTAASSIEVSGSNTFGIALPISAANGGTAQGLSKIGTGTLVLNSTPNVNTSLTIGGVPGGGGTVLTQMTTGTPFGAGAITLTDGTLALQGTVGTAPVGVVVGTAQAAASYIINVGNSAGIVPGMTITNASIPAGAVVTGVSGNNVTISAPTTAAIASGQALTFGVVNQALTATAMTYNAGRIQLTKGTGVTSQLTATALTRGTNGLATLISSDLATDLGVNERFLTGTAQTTTSGILATPSIVGRASTGADTNSLNFLRYDVTNGFLLHNATLAANLNASAATSLGDFSAAQVVAAGTIDLLALRTSSNITPTDGTSLLRLANGGLIMNGTTAPAISSNLRFGTLAAPQEALVWVSGGQTGASTISGNFEATDFTKGGAGTLLLSGTTNVMAPTTTALRNLTLQEGTLRFAGQSSVPSGGLINLVVNSSANGFDLNGQAITVGGLSGYGRVMNSGAVSTLTVNTGVGQNTTYTGTLDGNVAITKTGNGTLTLNQPRNADGASLANTYSGGTIINAGRVTSANAVAPVSTGTLAVRNTLGLGTGPITLKGGILDLAAIAGNGYAVGEVIDNTNVMQFGHGSGYNLTVDQFNSFGNGSTYANTTSTLTNGATSVGWSLVNNVTLNASALSFNSTSNIGVMINGTLTMNQNATLNTLFTTGNNFNSAVISGKIAATGLTVTKIGGGTLFLTNGDTGSGANDVGAWRLMAGTTDVRLSNGASNPLGASAPITLNGATLTISHEGDNTANMQVLNTFAGNNFTIGSTATLGGGSYIGSGAATFNINRAGSGSNKTLQFGTLAFGGPLGSPLLTLNNSGDNFQLSSSFTGLTLIKDAQMTNNSRGGGNGNVTINGPISGNGTILKGGGGSLFINSDNSATFAGGFVNAAGTTFFGTFEGNVTTLSDTPGSIPGLVAASNYGTGNALIQPGSAIQFNSTDNKVGSGSVDLRSNAMANYGILRMAANAPLSDFNLLIGNLGGPQDTSYFGLAGGNGFNGGGKNAGSAIIALNTVYTQAIDLAKIGDGTAFLGSTANGVGLNGSYNAATLGAGAGNTYRLGAGGSILYVSSDMANSNVLTGTGAALTVGQPFSGLNTDTITAGSGRGTVVLMTNNNYTGATTVNRLSTLEFRGSLTTSSFDNWGTLTAGGLGGTFMDAAGTAPLAPVTLRNTSEVRFDNSTGLLATTKLEGYGGQGRWDDDTAVVLDNSTIRLIGNRDIEVTETVGDVTVGKFGQLAVQRDLLNRTVNLVVGGGAGADITRQTQTNNGLAITGNTASLQINPVSGGQLGSDERIKLFGGTGATGLTAIGGITNGMVAPWMVNATDFQFLTYTADNGFVNAGFDGIRSGALGTTSVPTERTFINAAASMIGGGGLALDTYALRLETGDITFASGTPAATDRIQVRSGGLLINGGRTIAPGISFGASPQEANIFNNNNLVMGSLGTVGIVPTTGQITNATNIVKHGGGTLFIDAAQRSFNGNYIINQGALNLRNNASATVAVPSASLGGTATLAQMNAGTNGLVVINNFNSSLTVSSDVGGVVASTFTSTSGSPTIAVTSATGLVVGQPIAGHGIPAGAFIGSIATLNVGLVNANGAPLNATVTQATAANNNFVANAGSTVNLSGATTTAGSTTVTVASTAGLLPGMALYGAGVNALTVAEITSPTTFRLSAAPTTAVGTGLQFAGVVGTTGFNVGFVLGDGNPMANLNVNRAGALTTAITSGNMVMNGGIRFGGSPGEQGQTLNFNNPTGGTTFNLLVRGGLDLGPGTLEGAPAYAFISTGVNAIGTTLRIDGQVTGAGTLVKTGGQTLELNNVNTGLLNTNSGGIQVVQGTLNVRGTSTGAQMTGATVAASTTITVPDTTNLVVGMLVSGPGIPANSTVLTKPTATTFTIGTAATAQTGPQTLFFYAAGSLNIFASGIPNNLANTTTITGTSAPMTSGGIGSGALTLYGGVTNLRMDVGNADATRQRFWAGNNTSGNSLIVNGGSTISIDRNSALGGSNKHLAFKDLTIGSTTLNASTGNTYVLEINGATNLTGTPLLNVTGGSMLLQGAVNDGAGSTAGTIGQAIIKGGAGDLWLNSTASSFGGLYAGSTSTNGLGIVVNGGLLRFGDGGTDNATPMNLDTMLRGSTVRINPTGGIFLTNPANVNFGTGQVELLSSGSQMGLFRVQSAALNQAYLQNALSSNSQGVIALNASIANPLNLALIGNGRSFFGATANSNYTAETLGVGADNLYRIGGGGANLTLNSTAAANAGIFVQGATPGTRVLIGSQAVNGNSPVIDNFDLHTYTGGTVISRSSSTAFHETSTATAGPLGMGGAVDIFGQLQAYDRGTFLNAAGTANAYAVNLHPGSVLWLDNDAVNVTNRWDDATAIDLNGGQLYFRSRNDAAVTSTETVGAINYSRGSSVRLDRRLGNGAAALTTPSLNRAGVGSTLLLSTTAANLGVVGNDNAERLIVSGGATAITPSGVVNGMLPAYIVNGGDNTFVTYGANGVGNVTYDNTFAGGVFSTNTTGISKVDITTAAMVLTQDQTVYALRTSQNISSGVGQYNTLTFADGATDADRGGLITTGTPTIATNLRFGTTGTKEGIIFTAGNTILSGDIYAGSITKFGGSTLTIAKDQTAAANGTGFAGNWTINGGALTLNTFGASGGGGTITLNASGTATAAGTTLNLSAAPGSSLNGQYTMGRIIAVDNAIINVTPALADSAVGISDLESFSTDTTGLSPARLRVAFGNNARIVLNAGTLSLTGTGASIIDINQQNLNNQITSGTTGAGLNLTGLNGSRDLIKWGNGSLWVGGNNTSFTGNVSVEQGALGITNANALVNAASITARRYGILDILTTGFNKAVTYEAGSIERWSVDNARSGTINLGAGTLQVNADQNTTTATIQINGGAIEGFLRTDDVSSNNSGTVFRTLGSGVNFTLAGNSFLGQNYFTDGPNGTDNGRTADLATGVGSDTNNSSDLTSTARGAILEIKGNISGAGGLTKQSTDTVILSGTNTYSGATNIANGTLRLGSGTALPTGNNVTTSGRGVLDLGGFNTSIGNLNSAAIAQPTTGTVFASNGGFITNSATEMKTLTVTPTAASTYAGVVQNNITVVKAGGQKLTFTNVNTYTGETNVNGGVLDVSHVTGTAGTGVIDGIKNTSKLTVANGATFNAVTGSIGGTLTLAGTSGTVLELAAGSRLGVEVGPNTGTNTGSGAGQNTGSSIRLNPNAQAQVLGNVAVDAYFLPGIVTHAGVSDILVAQGGGLVSTNGSSGTYSVGNLYNVTNFTVTGITASDTLVQFNVAPATALTNAFWKGGFAGNPNVWAVSNGSTLSNWATDLAGTDTGLVPASTTNVFVSVTTPTDQNNMVLGSNMSINSLTLNATSGTPVVLQSTGDYTLTIGGAAAITSDATSGVATFNNKIALTNATPTIAVNSTNTLTLAGPVSGAATSLTKTGTGTLVLSGANTYAGATTISAGILSAANDLALGTTAGNTTVANNGSLELQGNVTIAFETLGLTGDGATVGADTSGGALRNLSGNNIVTGAITLAAATTVQSDAGTLNINGGMTGAFPLTVEGAGNTVINGIVGTAAGTIIKNDAGTLTLNNVNTYTGATTINGGILSVAASANLGNASATNTLAMNGGTLQTTASFDLGTNRALALGAGGGTIDVAASTTVTLPAAISGTGGLTKAGAGTLELNGAAANTFSGLTTISAGVLRLNKTPGINAIVGDSVSSKVTPDVLINGGTLILAGNNQLDNSVFINMTSGVFNVNGRTDTIYWFANSGGTYLSPRGSALTVIDPTWSGGNNDLFGNDTYGNLIIAGGTNIIHGAEGFGVGQNASLTVGSGGLEFQGVNNNLTLSSDDQSAGVLNLNGNVSFTGSAGTATITSGQALQSDGVTPAVVQPGANQGTVNLGASTRTFTIANGSAATDMSISARIIGTGGLTKDGAGLMALSGANTYTGTTAINGGTLNVGSVETAGVSGPLGVPATPANSISFGGGTLQYSAANQFDYSSRFSTAASQAVSIDTNGQNVTHATNLSSASGTVAKSGAGTLTFTAVNTYSGATTITGGALQIGTASITTASIATSGTTVSATGTLAGTGSVAGLTVVQSGGFIAPGDSAGATNNTLTLTANSATALVVDNGGQIQLGVTNATLTSTGFQTYWSGGSSVNALDYLNGIGSGDVALWNVAPASPTDHDRINLTGAGSNLSIGTRSAPAFGSGSVLVSGTVASPTIGMVFNLIDWMALTTMSGTFTNGGGTGIVAGGTSAGDLDLPSLSAGFGWDTSAFQSYGVLVIVPEPSRLMLLFFGLFGLFFRRRRND
jgi:autotransporter-associated beta strand protein